MTPTTVIYNHDHKQIYSSIRTINSPIPSSPFKIPTDKVHLQKKKTPRKVGIQHVDVVWNEIKQLLLISERN